MDDSDEMKLMIIIISDTDSDSLMKSMLNEGYRITRIASSGGFIRRGSSTLFMGVEAGRVERARQLVREHCGPSVDPNLKKVAIYVLKVDRFQKL